MRKSTTNPLLGAPAYLVYSQTHARTVTVNVVYYCAEKLSIIFNDFSIYIISIMRSVNIITEVCINKRVKATSLTE